MSTNDLAPDAPAPRLCHLFKRLNFDGYGFNLHAEKNKPGQFIGKVDDGSPAETAGLRSGDRIIEVNNVNIANENHKQVVERIKAVPCETKLLVVDEVADKYYKERKIVVKHTQNNVVYISSERNEEDDKEKAEDGVNGSETENIKSEANVKETITNNDENANTSQNDNDVTPVVTPVEEPRPESRISNVEETQVKNSPKPTKEDLNATTPSPKESPQQSPKVHEKSTLNDVSSGSKASEVTNGSTNNGRPVSLNGSASSITPPPVSNDGDKLNLNMSAQEMRALIANRSRNKFDPRKDSMDLRKKHAIIQSM